ncbi:ammonium transporter AmtB-like domain-containing protein [Mycena alexandri]|uniref:Ammonium transporter AmtB-like domain-containing protein n=1 Tax=Mycena alexandri TaxID=1745969 RepID=A0AAD6S3Z7_9AGAR|nr:ammonium transporter AmtB-like domain-containing protein [Mycena alexandri]
MSTSAYHPLALAARALNITYDPSGDLSWVDPADGKLYVYNGGDIAWTLTSTALVWIMIPGVGFFYSGLLRRKNALSMIYLSMMTVAVVSFQWFFWGFSLAFSETGSAFIGDLKPFYLIFLLGGAGTRCGLGRACGLAGAAAAARAGAAAAARAAAGAGSLVRVLARAGAGWRAAGTGAGWGWGWRVESTEVLVAGAGAGCRAAGTGAGWGWGWRVESTEVLARV